jgi:hypothetical protein
MLKTRAYYLSKQVQYKIGTSNNMVHQIDQEELIAVIMGAAAEKYLSVITSDQQVKGNLMSLTDLKIVMY